VSLTAGALIGFLACVPTPQDEKPFQAELRRFQDDYYKVGAKDDDKIAAVRALAPYHHERIVRALSPLLTEASIPVRLMTARELGRFAGVDPAARELHAALRSAANSGKRESAVRIEILRGLGTLRYAPAGGDVAKLVEDKEVWVAKAAIDAAGRIRTLDALTPLIKSLRRIESNNGDSETTLNPLDDLFPEMPTAGTLLRADPRQTAKRPSEREVLKAPILGALQSISRQNYENARDWETWWSKRKPSFKLPE